MALVSVSLLSADFLHLGQEIAALEKARADLLHIDVMDGHFVPNLTIGPVVLSAIRKQTKLPLDVHLMIDNPETYIDTYIDCGADFLTVHTESCIHLERALDRIKQRGKKAGVALNPSTSEGALKYIIKDVDLVLVMSVNPGFAQQKFLKSALDKISAIKAMLIKAKNPDCLISVDGGISDKNASEVKRAGATCLVSGSYIFANKNYEASINGLK